MKRQEKIDYLWANHSKEWLKCRQEAYEHLSNLQSVFCCCGKLATGYHERHCRKFNAKVDAYALSMPEIQSLLKP